MNFSKLLKQPLFGVAVLFFGFLHSQISQGAGFEKGVFWSGRYAGVAGAAVSSAEGAHALYFNPAGLASPGGQINLNFSPNFSQFTAPVSRSATASNNTSMNSNTVFAPMGGVLGSYALGEKLGLGVGAFLAGGNKIIYKGVNTDMGSKEIAGEIILTELSLGLGYEVCDGFKIGAAWRASIVSGRFTNYLYNTTIGSHFFSVSDAKQTKFSGARVGAQYRPKDGHWGIGANWRSPVAFAAKGTGSWEVPAFGSSAYTGDITVNSRFPMAIDVGGDFPLTDTLQMYLQYDWLNYSALKGIGFSGDLATNPAGAKFSDFGVPLDWMDSHVIRLGMEYSGLESWTLRGGWASASPATKKRTALATFSSPAPGHAAYFGVGTNFLEKSLLLDLAAEYEFLSTNVAAADNAYGLGGKYSGKAYGVHTSLTYNF